MDKNIVFRSATRADVDSLVAMLADDEIGKTRENYASPLPECYYTAFAAIDEDTNNHLVVVETENKIIGMMQITYLPYLTHQGSWRSLIEGVRISRDYRGAGIGQLMFEWAIEQARKKGCYQVQLTSDKKRERAIHFYKKLGFVETHEGMKLNL